ncbi:MAG: protein phosphatase 2C domain-containing protein [Congregibacter sp.]
MIPYAARTHPGLRRSKNEDNYAVDPERGLWVVADGVGGHTNGEVASAIACDTIIEDVAKGIDLRSAIEHAHQSVLREIERREANNNMGTTVVALQLQGKRYKVAWVGDSRAYAYDGELSQLTRDHSAVNDLLDSGAITQAQAATHPQRHALSRSLGVSDNNESSVSVVEGTLKNGTQILLCTDGLTDELKDQAIHKELSHATDNEAQAEGLLNAALAKGGRDNLTVVIVGNPGARKATAAKETPDLETTQNIGGVEIPKSSGKRTLLWQLVALVSLLALAGVSLFN